MKKARKKRIVRRKRRISEREIMRIKRKLKKSARKLRLGAKRTGAYVYGTLRRIVGNPGLYSVYIDSKTKKIGSHHNVGKATASKIARYFRRLGYIVEVKRQSGSYRGAYGDKHFSIGNVGMWKEDIQKNPSFASLHPRDRATASKFVNYVYRFYGKGGLYAGDFGNRGFTRREIERAVAIYIDQIRKKKTEWGGGDSIDRERVRMILQPSYSMHIPAGRVTIRKNALPGPYYVWMTDKFMSGWGRAQGKLNKYVVKCDTLEQAECVFKNAQDRDEMKNVNYGRTLPYFSPAKYLVSMKTWNQLGYVWKRGCKWQSEDDYYSDPRRMG